VTLLYADTSAVIRAFLPDETDHAELRKLLLEGVDPVVTSELTRVEFASALSSAVRAGRVPDTSPVLAAFDRYCGEEGPITVIPLAPRVVMPAARHLVTAHPLRTLDALHLAVALQSAVKIAAGEAVAMVTRDHRQAAAAGAQGLAVL
jgi:uncharacterized protein